MTELREEIVKEEVEVDISPYKPVTKPLTKSRNSAPNVIKDSDGKPGAHKNSKSKTKSKYSQGNLFSFLGK